VDVRDVAERQGFAATLYRQYIAEEVQLRNSESKSHVLGCADERMRMAALKSGVQIDAR
jgi:hypothetical protein